MTVRVLSPEQKVKQAERVRIWTAKPENKAKAAARAATPEAKAKRAAQHIARYAIPENRARKAAYTAIYKAKPENRARERARSNAKYAIPIHKAHQIAVSAAFYATPEGRASRLVNAARSRARKIGREFNISAEDISPIIKIGICQATGKEFYMGPTPKGRSSNPFAPSIDRIDSVKGYTKDNIQIVIWAYNVAKSEGTHDELLYLAELIVAYNAIKCEKEAA